MTAVTATHHARLGLVAHIKVAVARVDRAMLLSTFRFKLSVPYHVQYPGIKGVCYWHSQYSSSTVQQLRQQDSMHPSIVHGTLGHAPQHKSCYLVITHTRESRDEIEDPSAPPRRAGRMPMSSQIEQGC